MYFGFYTWLPRTSLCQKRWTPPVLEFGWRRDIG